MRSNKEKVTYEHEEKNFIVDSDTGEVKQAQRTTHKVLRLEAEPSYVKLYLDHLSHFKGLQVSLNPILIEILKHTTYADDDTAEQGQIFVSAKLIKETIAKRCGVSLARVNQALTQFVKADILSRLAPGVYQVNPYLFGKGEWKDIKQIRATFNYNTGEVVADIVKDEEIEMATATEVLEKKYQQKIKELASQDPAENYLDKTQTTLFDVTNACVDTQAVSANEV